MMRIRVRSKNHISPLREVFMGASPTSTLKPGDILTLRGGAYVEAVRIANLAGTPGNEITIRSFSGERAVIDSGIADFRVTGAGAWIPAVTVDPAAHPDEWASTQTFPADGPAKPRRVPRPTVPSPGDLLDRTRFPIEQPDLRQDLQCWIRPDLTRSPWKVTSEQFVPIRDPAPARVHLPMGVHGAGSLPHPNPHRRIESTFDSLTPRSTFPGWRITSDRRIRTRSRWPSAM